MSVLLEVITNSEEMYALLIETHCENIVAIWAKTKAKYPDAVIANIYPSEEGKLEDIWEQVIAENPDIEAEIETGQFVDNGQS